MTADDHRTGQMGQPALPAARDWVGQPAAAGIRAGSDWARRAVGAALPAARDWIPPPATVEAGEAGSSPGERDTPAMLHRFTRPPLAGGGPPPQAALRQYRSVSLEARVAAASPHELVLMLFERLCHLLRDARAAGAADPARRLRASERALAIVDGLDSTLDDSRGGEVARSLHSAYASLRDRITEGNAAALSEAIRAADELAAAWRAIGRRAEG